MGTGNTRQRLIEAAAELVHARGYNAVGVQEVCEAANANKGSFYHFFESKESLMEAVVEERTGTLGAFLEAAGAQARAIDALMMMYDLLHLAVGEQRSSDGRVRGCPIGSVGAEVSTQSERLRTAVCGAFDRLEATAARLVERAAAEGDCQPEVAPEMMAGRLVAYVQGATLLAKTRNDPNVMRDLRSGYVDLLGLSNPSPLGQRPS